MPELVDRPSGVTSEQLVDIAGYWGDVYRSLEELESKKTSLFDGLSDEQTRLCLHKSTIIDCHPGDRILKRGNTAQNLYVLLDGVLEVHLDDEVQAVITPVEVFGEIAFLLGRPRTADVVAGAVNTRVLSLSESALRRLIGDEPEVAAQLLLNISRILCWRQPREAPAARAAIS